MTTKQMDRKSLVQKNNMKASQISIENAKQDKLFYFVANVVVYRDLDQKCFILKRDPREKVHPSKYAVPGGKLEWKDLDLQNPTRMNGDVIDFENAIEDLLAREVREESGVEIEKELKYLNNVAFVRPDGIPVILVKFAAKYKSGDVVLEEGAFTNYAWVNADEVKLYDCIEGVQKEVEETIEIFSK